jgi:hypothetical protein
MPYYTFSINLAVSKIITCIKLGMSSRKHRTPSHTFHGNPFSGSGVVTADKRTKEHTWIIGAISQLFIAIAPKIHIKYDLDCD